MDSLIFAFNAVAPIMLMVAIGYFLKKRGMLNGALARAMNKLVFHVFLPVMLFLNVYKIDGIESIELGPIAYGVVAILIIFLVSVPLFIAVTKKNSRRGVLIQSAFRSNYALVGIPLAQALFGDEGVAVASLTSMVIVPLTNMLAVVSLSLFRSDGKRTSAKEMLMGVVKNPLIRGVLTGVLALVVRYFFVKWGIEFRLSDITPVYTVMGYLSSLATPVALLMLGAQFEFSAVSALKREITVAVLMRTVIVPLFCIGAAYIFFRSSFNGAHFATYIAVFATPVAVSSVPMAQEMDGDADLAGQIVVWTTLVSALTVFVASFLLRYAGIF